MEKERYESENNIFVAGGNITLTEWFEEYMLLYKVDKVKVTTVYRIRQTYNSCRRNDSIL